MQRSATTHYQIVNARPVAEQIVRCSSTLVAPHNFLVPFLFSLCYRPSRRLCSANACPSLAASSVERGRRPCTEGEMAYRKGELTKR